MNIILQTFSTKTPENQIYIECASKLLSELYKESEAYFVKEFKTKVSELFQSNVYFIYFDIFIIFFFNRIFLNVQKKL